MIRVAIKGVLGRKLRAILTGFAIVLGVAMISGSFILTDTLAKSFDGAYEESYRATDAVISSNQSIETDDGGTETAPFDAAIQTRVQALDGVRSVLGTIEDEARLVDANGKLIGESGSGQAIAYAGSPDDDQNPLKLVQGAWPAAGDQIAVDRVTAAKHDFTVGQTVGAYAGGPAAKYRISGIVSFGKTGTIAGVTFLVFDYETAQHLFAKTGKLDAIRVGAKPGTSADQLVSQIRPLLSTTTQVQSSDAKAAADSKDTQEGMNAFKYFLLGFGGIALFVGSFVIANTLAITVAQRMRELATLRTLGATRRQVLASVVMESVIVGIVGSVIGLFLGLGIAVGLTKILEATGIELPSQSLVFATADDHRQRGRRHADRSPGQPPARTQGHAHRADLGRARGRGRCRRRGSPATSRLPPAASSALSIGLLSYGLFADGLDIKVAAVRAIAGVLFLFVGVAMVATRASARSPTCSALPAPGSAAAPAGSPARTRCATRRGPPPPPLRS